MSQLFPHSSERRFITKGADIFARIAGEGPPLLLIHGFPQTHAMCTGLRPS